MEAKVERVIDLMKQRIVEKNYSLPDPSQRSYSLGAFFTEDHREFTFRVYTALLKRNPDPAGLAGSLWNLGEGGSLLQELARVRNSPEGRESGVWVRGLQLALLLEPYSKHPVVARLLRIVGLLPPAQHSRHSTG